MNSNNQEHEITLSDIPDRIIDGLIVNAIRVVDMRTRFIEMTPSRIQRIREIFVNGERLSIEYAMKEPNVSNRTNREIERAISEEELRQIEETQDLFGELIATRYILEPDEQGIEVKLDLFHNVYSDGGKLFRVTSDDDPRLVSDTLRPYVKVELEGDAQIIDNLDLAGSIGIIESRTMLTDLQDEELSCMREVSEHSVYTFMDEIGGDDLEGKFGISMDLIP